MNEEILKLAISQGLWAVLFVVLLFYVLKENSKREGNYQGIIKKLTEKFDIVSVVSDKVDKIEFKVEEILRKER